MTEENRILLNRINKFAEEEMSDIDDPQKVPVSVQLDRLRPIFEEIAKEKNISLEDMFILYMDLQSEATAKSDKKLRDELKNINDGEGEDMPLLYN
ncbi:MAG: hypothetical protein IJ608_10485 [Lachnospiraceae bacterium]|nr:hypothetical protein [Lachnospiraceae bacterium]